MNVLSALQDRFQAALRRHVADPAPYLAMIRPVQDPKFGDYQANFAMPLGSQLKRPPREIAADVVSQVQLEDLCEPVEIAGPGFINLRIRNDVLVSLLDGARRDERLGIAPVAKPQTVIVDFSSPNVAKPMHVGHIRSTVIGDSLCRILRFAGHTVVSDNHLGDWGTQFGMIIYGYRNFADPQRYQREPVQELGRIYRQVRKLIDALESQRSLPELERRVAQLSAEVDRLRRETPTDKGEAKKHDKGLKKAVSSRDEATSDLNQLREKLATIAADAEMNRLLAEHADIEQAVLRETAKLHQGDSENRRLWHEFLPACRHDIQRIYDRLQVSFDEELGESFYHDRLEPVVDDLTARGLARESEGAICVFLPDHESPMIIRKRDGAYLYATTDLATVQYRLERWKPDKILYVVDFRQGEHFEKLFATVKVWGYDQIDLRHIRFGTVLDESGRPYKTRAGDTVGLEGLLDESERKAYEVVSASDDAKPQGGELDEAERRQIARVVGIAALKYADLSQNRDSDYVFSYDKMLALTGNTATYMQYSYARVHGIFRRGEINIEKLRSSSAPLLLEHLAERSLALQLLRFHEALEDALIDYRPNHLTNYLYELARTYTSFFEQCPVLKAETAELRDSRTLLCDLTARTLKLGLSLLGIEVVERM